MYPAVSGCPQNISRSTLAVLLITVCVFALSGCGGGGGGSAGTPPPATGGGTGGGDTGGGTGGGDTGGGTGGGNGGGGTPTRPPTPMPYVVDGLVANPSTSFIAKSAADTRDSALASGETLAPLTVGIDRNFGTGPDRGVGAPKEGMTYLKSISSDGAGGLHVNYVLGGEETPVHLTAADVYQNREFDYRKQMDDGSGYWLWRYSSFFSTELGFTYFDGSAWRYIPAPDSGPDRRGVTIYGARTAPENLPAMGGAIYEGRMDADVWNADDPSFDSSRTNFYGRLTLKANFDDGEISGWINRFRIRNSRNDGNVWRWLGRGSLITISGGKIDDGRFTADWTGSDSNMDPDPNYSVGGFSGKMLGEFFGPAAEEVGGVLNGNRAATATTSEQHLFGLFGAIGRQPAVRDSTEAFEPDYAFTLEQEFSGADMGVRTPDQGEAYVKSIAKDGAGGARVTYVVNGVESVIDFGARDANRVGTWGKVVGDNEYYLWSFGWGLNYAEITGWAHDINASGGSPSDNPIKRYRGHNVHGDATENMPATGSATYEGRLYAEGRDVNQPDPNLGRTRFRGALTLQANFANAEISGQFDNLSISGPGESQYEALASGNSFEISNGAISGSGFTADWTGMDTNASSAPGDSVRGFSGTMSGGFYGPAAAEVVGTLSGRRAATASTNESLLLGSFGAKKMP